LSYFHLEILFNSTALAEKLINYANAEALPYPSFAEGVPHPCFAEDFPSPCFTECIPCPFYTESLPCPFYTEDIPEPNYPVEVAVFRLHMFSIETSGYIKQSKHYKGGCNYKCSLTEYGRNHQARECARRKNKFANKAC
jgi:hypothetical protein